MREAGRFLGKSDSYISHIENGRLNVPSGEALQELLGVYGVGDSEAFYKQVETYKQVNLKRYELENLIKKLSARQVDFLIQFSRKLLV